jgi:hypothetical protein
MNLEEMLVEEESKLGSALAGIRGALSAIRGTSAVAAGQSHHRSGVDRRHSNGNNSGMRRIAVSSVQPKSRRVVSDATKRKIGRTQKRIWKLKHEKAAAGSKK